MVAVRGVRGPDRSHVCHRGLAGPGSLSRTRWAPAVETHVRQGELPPGEARVSSSRYTGLIAGL